MIYFVYLLVLLVFLYIERRSGEKASRIIRGIIPILYALLIGLRGRHVGVDTHTYYDHFYTYGQWGCNFIEPGFDWLNRMIYAWGGNANIFFLANAFITCFFFYLALNRLKGAKYSIAALCIYLLSYSFLVNGIRQGIAISIFIYAYQFIEKKKILIYCLLILLASRFHASSLILLPLYFLNYLSLSNKAVILIYMASFIGIIADVSSYLPELEIGGRNYSYAQDYPSSDASALGFIVTTALNIFILALMLKNGSFQKMKVLAYLVLLGFVFKNLGFGSPIIGRVTIYFTWFVYLLYPYILIGPGHRPLFKSTQVTVFLVIAINSAVWINALLSSANRLTPYKFYWEEQATYIR